MNGQNRRAAMGSHQSSRSITDIWLTPPETLKALGRFDLDPCAVSEPGPWPTATAHFTSEDDGLNKEWHGRVWMSPPYSDADRCLSRLAAHGTGTALLFARTETGLFQSHVWGCASALLFLKGRLHFHRPDGIRAPMNAGAPSVLVAYGQADAEALRDSGLPGALRAGWRYAA